MKCIMRIFSVTVAAMLLLSGCMSTQSADDADFKEIAQKLSDDFGKAMLNEDIEFFRSLHDEGVVKLYPGKPPVVGLEQEVKAKKMAFANGTIESFEKIVLEAEASGDLGISRGTVAYVYVPDAGGEKMKISGKFLNVFRRSEDGSWKIYRGCWNSP